MLNLDKLWRCVELTHKQALQGEIFPNGIVTEQGKIRTNGLAPTFSLIEALEDANVNLVTPSEFESEFSG